VGKGARVEENEIEEAEEHQLVTTEVRLHWIGVQGGVWVPVDGDLEARRRFDRRWWTEQWKMDGKETCNCRSVC
jgi:hypothetical protein